MQPSIDILMAVYNNEEFILEQLESLACQTYPHFRIIIRDDCSSDGSVSLIEEFSSRHPDRVILIKGTENLGAKGNFAKLMDECKSKYAMFCDADDIWSPTKIEETLHLMQKNEALYGEKTPLLVHTDLSVVDRNLQSVCPSFWDYSQLNPHSARSINRLLTQNVVTGCTMLINRPLLELASPIPQEAVMHDWWIALVASAFGHIDFTLKPTILYRQHGKNSIGAKNKKSFSVIWQEAKKALKPAGRQELKAKLLKTIQQAAQFKIRYGNFLGETHTRIIEDFASLERNRAAIKRYLFFKRRFFKNTFAQNICMFFLM